MERRLCLTLPSMNALISITEINSLYDQRPIIEKQASYAFVHPFAEAFGGIVSDIPVKFVAAVVFNVIYYFLAGLVGSCKILIRAKLMSTAL
jgi:ABC-type multidrug transport system permease subunit